MLGLLEIASAAWAYTHIVRGGHPSPLLPMLLPSSCPRSSPPARRTYTQIRTDALSRRRPTPPLRPQTDGVLTDDEMALMMRIEWFLRADLAILFVRCARGSSAHTRIRGRAGGRERAQGRGRGL